MTIQVTLNNSYLQKDKFTNRSQVQGGRVQAANYIHF